MKTIEVLVDRPYPVHIGQDLLNDIAGAVPTSANKVAIIFAPAVTSRAHSIGDLLKQEVVYVELPDGELAKTPQALQECWEILGKNAFTRSDFIISVGGGATSDLAGFVAATWLRGVNAIHVPTTLLAMVDAAVGGKTGINISAGKNLVGAFHHPHSVWCDIETLNTLPIADLRAGFGEIVKCGFISDVVILDVVRKHGAQLVDVQHPALIELISRSIAVKAAVVADDFTESKIGGLGREILNYGHTLAHAIEKFENYGRRHGEAVSIGMVFVAELSAQLGKLSQAEVAEHRLLLQSLGLPTSYDGRAWPELRGAMSIDKKSRGDVLRFVVLESIGVPAIAESPSEEQLQAAFVAISVGGGR